MGEANVGHLERPRNNCNVFRYTHSLFNTCQQQKFWTEKVRTETLKFLSSEKKKLFSPCSTLAQTGLLTSKHSETYCQQSFTVWKTGSFGKKKRTGKFFHNVWECLACRKSLLASCHSAWETEHRTADSADSILMCSFCCYFQCFSSSLVKARERQEEPFTAPFEAHSRFSFNSKVSEPALDQTILCFCSRPRFPRSSCLNHRSQP